VVPPPPKISTEVVEPDLEPAADRSGEEDRYGEPDEPGAEEPQVDDAEPPTAEHRRIDEPVPDQAREFPHEPGPEGGREPGREPGNGAGPGGGRPAEPGHQYGREPHDGRFGPAGPAPQERRPNGEYPAERPEVRDEPPGDRAERMPENAAFRAPAPGRPENR
jgi:hypothetical protein